MRKRLLSWRQRAWIYESWCFGYTYVEIADALGVCPKTVQRAIAGKPKIKPVLVCPWRIKEACCYEDKEGGEEK